MYPRNPHLKVFWLLPSLDFPDGLRLVVSEKDTAIMASLVDRVKTLVIYFDHEAMTTGADWDDVVANPIASLPRVVSPCKGQSKHTSNEERDDGHEGDSSSDENSSVHEGDSSNDDCDFEDSDYDLEGDDDLFVDNVDDHVTDEGAARGKKIGKGSKRAAAARSSKVPVGDEQDDESTDDDGLQLPECDGEGAQGYKSKYFKPEDMANPVFKVGMKFDSVELRRKAITEYSLRNRVDIRVPRNEQSRLEAYCAKGCLWTLKAAPDKRFKCFMIKTYNGTHSC